MGEWEVRKGAAAKGNEISFWNDEYGLKLILVRMHNSVSTLTTIVHFKWLNCLGYELYFNKTVSKKKLRKSE